MDLFQLLRSEAYMSNIAFGVTQCSGAQPAPAHMQVATVCPSPEPTRDPSPSQVQVLPTCVRKHAP